MSSTMVAMSGSPTCAIDSVHPLHDPASSQIAGLSGALAAVVMAWATVAAPLSVSPIPAATAAQYFMKSRRDTPRAASCGGK
jgi:hypothetical protein